MKLVTQREILKSEISEIYNILWSNNVEFGLIEYDHNKTMESISKLDFASKVRIRRYLYQFDLKPCWNCGCIKELSDFPKDKAKENGVGGLCNTCNAEKMARWRVENPEKHQAQVLKLRVARNGAEKEIYSSIDKLAEDIKAIREFIEEGETEIISNMVRYVLEKIVSENMEGFVDE